MAGAYVSLVMQAVRDGEASAKLVLLTLADCANMKDSGVCYPSIETIARRSLVTPRHAQRILRELVLDAWLIVEKASKGGSGRTTRYRLNLPKMRADAQRIPDVGVMVSDGENPDAGVMDNPDAGVMDGVVDNSKNPDTHVTHTLTFGGKNPDTHVTRSLEPEVINKPSEPISIAKLMREALKGNGNRNPLESGKGQEQPEKPAGLRTVGAQPAGMSQAEQIAYVERMAREAK